MWDKETLLNLIDSLPFMILFKDTQDRLVWMNRAYAEGMGFSPQEVVGKRTSELLPQGDRFYQEDLEVMSRGEASLDLLREVILPSGRKTWHLTDKVPVRSPDGAVEGIAVFVRDVTELVEAQKRLERLSRVLKTVSNVNQLIVRSAERGGLLDEVCRTLVSTRCYEDAWIILLDPSAKSVSEIFASSFDSKSRLKRSLSDRQLVSLLEATPSDGTLVFDYDSPTWAKDLLSQLPVAQVMLSVRLEYDGRTYGVMGILMPADVKFDVEEKRTLLEMADDLAYALHVFEVREELHKERLLMKSLFEASPEGIALTMPDGRILRVNDAFCRIYGFAKPEEIIGKVIDDLITDESCRNEAVHFTEVVASGRSIATDGVRRRADGTPIDVSILGVPIRMNGNIINVYAIYRDIRDRKAAEHATRQAFEHLERLWRQTIELLVAASELRDLYTAGHQRRVAELAKNIAAKLGLSSDVVDAVNMAALIHDVGKIKVPAEILSKPGPLSEVEYLLVKTHPQAGYDLLKGIDFPWPVAEVVLQHHERLDGSGYPQGLEGQEVRLEARIIAVADVVEAMASDRPYRRALGVEAALKEIREHRGTLYDEDVVDACCVLFEDGFVLPPQPHFSVMSAAAPAPIIRDGF